MDLRALFINTSLKKTSDKSHTRLLMNASASIMERQGVAVEHLHFAAYDVPPGVYPDMTEHGYDSDEWPTIWEKVLAADILIIGTPLWLGEESSICRILIERLYAMSGELNDKGQSIYYGKVGGVRHHGQRGRHQAHRHDDWVCSKPSGLYDSSAGRLRLDR